MSEWPRIAGAARGSAPPDSRWLANEWRSVWGEIRSPIPAASAQRRIRFHRVCRGIAVPRRGGDRGAGGRGAAVPGRLDVGDGACGEDPLAHEEPEEGAHRGDVPGGGTGREPLVPQRREVFEEVGARKRLRVEPPVREEGGEAADVRAVRRQRVLRKAPLRFQVEEEGLEEGGVVHHSPSGGRGISTIRGSIVEIPLPPE